MLLVETVLEFWWLEITNRTLKTTITWKLVVFYISWPSWKIFQLKFRAVALCYSLSRRAYAGNISFQSWICYVQWRTLVIESVNWIISNFINNCPIEAATARPGFLRNCSLCQPWPEGRVKMAPSRTKLHWVVVMPVISDGIMTPLIQLQRACVYWIRWIARLFNNMKPLISAPP